MPQAALDPQKYAEVMRLKQKGYSHKQVAEMADVSTGTVSNIFHSKPKASRIDEYAEFHREKFLELKERFNKWIGNSEKLKHPKRKTGKRLIEAGCLAKAPDYAGDPKLRGAQRPTVQGYTLVYQDNGVSDINASNFIQQA